MVEEEWWPSGHAVIGKWSASVGHYFPITSVPVMCYYLDVTVCVWFCGKAAVFYCLAKLWISWSIGFINCWYWKKETFDLFCSGTCEPAGDGGTAAGWVALRTPSNHSVHDRLGLQGTCREKERGRESGREKELSLMVQKKTKKQNPDSGQWWKEKDWEDLWLAIYLLFPYLFFVCLFVFDGFWVSNTNFGKIK